MMGLLKMQLRFLDFERIEECGFPQRRRKFLFYIWKHTNLEGENPKKTLLIHLFKYGKLQKGTA